MRLSEEDEFCHEESSSISMQRFLLRDYVWEHFSDAKVFEFADDGDSGTNFDRPVIQDLMGRGRNYEINCIIVKDFSRFARDYIELGSYLEQLFPFMGVRFISINDRYDSDKYGGNVADIDVNFKNLLYDLYSKELSVKIKTSMLRMLKNRVYVGDLVQGTYECEKIRSDKRVTDSEKWIITENHHEPVVGRGTFDKAQARFGKNDKPWKWRDRHILVGRMVCGCYGRTFRHCVVGHHYY